MQKRILVVEDDRDLRRMLSLALKSAGYGVASVGNGLQALRSTWALRPDAIVLDLLLPVMDGFTVCESLRRHPETAAIPILVLTGLSTQLGRFAGLESGANDFVTKPFSIGDLMARIERLVTPTGA